MSRSYKKHPWCTDGRDGRVIPKRFANKAVRRYKHKLANGKAYKKLFCSWEIHDYISRWPWQEAKKEYEEDSSDWWKEACPTLKDFYKYWSKWYRRK